MFTLGPCSGVLKLDQSAHPVMLGWDDILTATLPGSVTVHEMDATDQIAGFVDVPFSEEGAENLIWEDPFKNVIRAGVTVWDLLLGQVLQITGHYFNINAILCVGPLRSGT